MTKVGAVLVAGGGIGGMQAALDLAESDFKVYLVEHGPSIGGVMAQLDKTFPTNDCAMCTMAPRLVEVARHPNIELLTHSEIEGVSGEAGRFEVAVRRRTRYVDEKKCTGCGICAEHCPVLTRDTFNRGLSARPAVYLLYPQAIPRAYTIDRSLCLGCGLCKNLCGPGAIDYRLDDEVRTIEVGAIVATPGFDLFDPKLNGEYGYGRFPNVVTSLDFERILSASGPYRGTILRPSDGKVPRRVAFIQCVGSRDHERDYCSAVCCMYTAKHAIIAKEHVGEHLQCDVFFMDIRSYGKGFEHYYNRAKQLGVRYIRCRPPSVEEVPATGDILIQYLAEDDTKRSGEYDLLVLAAGLLPSKSTPDLARQLGLSLNRFGFCDAQPFTPVQSSREGVFVAGTFTSPKDIPETVVQACAAASKAMTLLAEARGELTHRKEFPPERDVVGAEPRIGVFVCHCGTNIGGVANVPEIVEYARTLSNVVHAEESLYQCAADSTAKIGQRIEEHNLNRVVVASCTPRTHEALFRTVCREAGLNEYLFEMANIRDQNTWVHMKEPVRATKKAKDLVRMAVAKARLLQPLKKGSIRIHKSALVIGGGISGMTAALDLADQGFPVHLIEKEKELGGHLRRIRKMLGGEDPQKRLAEITEKVLRHPKISVHTETRLVSSEGSLGNFRSKTSSHGAEAEIEHGAVIVAIGALEYKPTEYMYGRDPRIITQSELEERIAGDGDRRLDPPPRTVVMIQCVGSRDDQRPYCSRICCSQATKNALTLKDLYPETETFVLYRDVRTYGLMEEYYTKARERGVRYILFDETKRPGVAVEDGRLQVQAYDATLQLTLGIEADLLVLSNGVIPAEDTAGLAQILKVPLSQEKFLLEAHMKLRPVDFANDGIFLCGSAHFPKHVEECIAQASATASRAATILAKEAMELDAAISEVNDKNCDGCAYCVDPCPYKAITLIEYMMSGAIKKTVERDEAKCKGCGVCQATCPKMGIFVRGFTPDQLSAMVNAALENRT